MEFPTKLHLGPTFDPVRYEELEKIAQRNYDIDIKFGVAEEEAQTRTASCLRFRFRLPALKKMATKARSAFSRLASRRNRRATTAELGEQALGSQELHDLNTEQTPQPIEPNKEGLGETSAPGQSMERLSEREKLVAMIGTGDDLSSDGHYFDDDSPRRYKHQMPCEEEQPFIEEGLVSRLARLLDPHFTSSLPSSKTSQDTAPSTPFAEVNKDKDIIMLENATCIPSPTAIPSPSPLVGPSLGVKSSSLTSEEHEDKNNKVCQIENASMGSQ